MLANVRFCPLPERTPSSAKSLLRWNVAQSFVSVARIGAENLGRPVPADQKDVQRLAVVAGCPRRAHGPRSHTLPPRQCGTRPIFAARPSPTCSGPAALRTCRRPVAQIRFIPSALSRPDNSRSHWFSSPPSAYPEQVTGPAAYTVRIAAKMNLPVVLSRLR